MKLSNLILAGGLALACVAVAACGATDGYEGGGRGAPAGGGGGGGASATEDDLGGTEVPPDPQFDTATDDPPADPE
jgi:hypothetical protein